MLNSRKQNDVTIIGASLAGVVAAYLLGSAGKRVALIDPQQFPRRKACGEGLSAIGVSYLKSMGLWSEEVSSGAHPYYGYGIQFSSGHSLLLQGARKREPLGYGISRVVLDSSIHKKVKELSSVTLINERVDNVSFHQERPVVHVANQGPFTSRHLFVACGGRAVSKLFPEASFIESEQERFGLAFWCQGAWRSQPPSVVQIFNHEEGQYIITPIGKNSVNMSMLLSKTLSSRMKKEDVLSRALELLDGAGFSVSEKSETLGAPVIHSARFQRQAYPAFFIGDAVERFDPIGGMGMAHALFSASRAVSSFMQQQGPQHYLQRRAAGARVLRQLTAMSYALNVKQTWMIKKIVQSAPLFAFQMTEALKHTFPTLSQDCFAYLNVPSLPQEPHYQTPCYCEERI